MSGIGDDKGKLSLEIRFIQRNKSNSKQQQKRQVIFDNLILADINCVHNYQTLKKDTSVSRTKAFVTIP